MSTSSGVAVLGQPAQHVEGLHVVDAVALHDDALGLADAVPGGKRRLAAARPAGWPGSPRPHGRASTTPMVSSFASKGVGLEREQVQRAGGPVAGVQLERQSAEYADLDHRRRVLGPAALFAKSSVRTISSSSAASMHGPSLNFICSSSSRCGRSDVPASDSNFPPLPMSSTPAVSAPRDQLHAAAVTSDSTSSTVRGAATARASSAIR